MRRAARVDANQPAVVEALRKAGAEVTHMHQLGGGVPDLLVSFRQRWFLMEVKSGEGVLSEDQRTWIGKQRAPVYVVKGPEQAVRFLNDVSPDWLLGLEVAGIRERTHICEGPSGEDEEAPGRQRPTPILPRVLEALQAAWRSHTKLSVNDLCERLGASKTSKRVEKALRVLCRDGKAQREGNNRHALYWAE